MDFLARCHWWNSIQRCHHHVYHAWLVDLSSWIISITTKNSPKVAVAGMLLGTFLPGDTMCIRRNVAFLGPRGMIWHILRSSRKIRYPSAPMREASHLQRMRHMISWNGSTHELRNERVEGVTR